MLRTTVSKTPISTTSKPNSIQSKIAVVLHNVVTDGEQQQVITKHDIIDEHLSEGKVINSTQVQRLLSEKRDFFAREDNAKPLCGSLIDKRVIAENTNDIVFYDPPSQRTLWYSINKNTKFSILSPGLLFHYNKNSKKLWVFCYLNRNEPKLDTMLYLPPMLNISRNGSVCTGTMQLPKTWSKEGIDLIISSFFNSRFTHSNMKSAGGLPEIYTNDHANMTYMAALEQSKRKMKKSELVPFKTLIAYLENEND